jgi:hypothetical protein
MSIFWVNYFFYLCSAGFVVLLILSIMALCDTQALKIEEGKNVKSGVVLLICSIVRKYLKENLTILLSK